MCFIIQLWNDTLTKLKVDVTQHDVILTESELNVREDRATMAQIVFEKYGAPGLCIGNESALSLFTHQQNTGVVVDCGHLITTIAVIIEGRRRQIPNTVLNYGGRDVTMRLLSDLSESGYQEMNSHVNAVQKIKEKVVCVSCNYDENVRFPEQMVSMSVPCKFVKDHVRNTKL